MSSRQVRVVRGVAAAAVATFVALFSHMIGGGEVPSLLGVLVPLVASMWPAVFLAGRRLSLWRLSMTVAISQALFHFLFVLGAVPSSAAPLTSQGHAGHGAMMVSPVVALSSSPAAVGAHSDPLMWLSHGVAALVTIVLLYRGERTLIRLRELATQMVEWLRTRFVLVPVPAFHRSLLRPLACWEDDARATRLELTPLLRRGPPLLQAV